MTTRPLPARPKPLHVQAVQVLAQKKVGQPLSRPPAIAHGLTHGLAEFWDERYAEPGFAFGERPNAFLAAQHQLVTPSMRALVPGDGDGRNGVWLAERGAHVTTVDASPVGVHKARLLAAERGVTIDAHVADLDTWAWPKAEFDFIAAIYLHFPSAQRPRLHRRMVSALKPGGLLLLEGYTPRQLMYRTRGSRGGPSDPDMLFEPDDLAVDFGAAEVLHIEELVVDLAEGERHRGPSAIVRLVARARA
jgi:SAM-dependent methyltransferase